MSHLNHEQTAAVLRYWREFEDMFIPEWKPGGKDGSRTPPDLDFARWAQLERRLDEHNKQQDKVFEQMLKKGKDYKKRQYSIMIMCQCHSGGYLLDDPGLFRKPTKTYAVGFVITLERDEEGRICLSMVENEDQWVINRTLLRELIRVAPEGGDMGKTVGEQIDHQADRLRESLSEMWHELYDPEAFWEKPVFTLRQILVDLNRRVSALLWPSKPLNDMMGKCAVIDLECFDSKTRTGDYFQDEKDEGRLQFSWRWMETHDQNDPEQIGPFFAGDLANLSERLKKGEPFSPALRQYLSGSARDFVGQAAGGQDPHICRLTREVRAYGRWPSNPAYGLVTMQFCALAASRQLNEQNPLLAVNGPPGTGKTTLLKDIIADRMVTRTREMLSQDFDYGWYNFDSKKAPTPVPGVLDHSIVVVSSNNKAVENISGELPGMDAVHPSFSERLRYFTNLTAARREWGPFCAVLGNAGNRKRFMNETLEPLRDHLGNVDDPLGLRYLRNALNKQPTRDLTHWLDQWRLDRNDLHEVLGEHGNQQTAALSKLVSPLIDFPPDPDSDDESFARYKQEMKQAQDKLAAWQRSLKDDPQQLKEFSTGMNRAANHCRELAKTRLIDNYQKARRQFLDRWDVVDSFWEKAAQLAPLLEQATRAEQTVAQVRSELAATAEPELLRGSLQHFESELQSREAAWRQVRDQLETSRKKLALLNSKQELAEQNQKQYDSMGTAGRLLSFGLKTLAGPQQFETQRRQAQVEAQEEELRCEELDRRYQAATAAVEPYRCASAYLALMRRETEANAQLSKLKKQIRRLQDELGASDDPAAYLIDPRAFLIGVDESPGEAEARLQRAMPWGTPLLNELRSQLFIDAMAVNQAVIELSAGSIAWALRQVGELLSRKLNSPDATNANLGLWSLHFLCFPVVSTTFASVEKQFALMKKPGTIGLMLVDEAGQTVTYSPVGLLQRSKQAVIVGDPLQLEPVVTIKPALDKHLASAFMRTRDLHPYERYLVSLSSAQQMADKASLIHGQIGAMSVGLPLRVHRRCDEPMFSLANSMAYGGNMIPGRTLNTFRSAWLSVQGKLVFEGPRYYNPEEIEVALELTIKLYQSAKPDQGVYIITPFRLMANQLKARFKSEIEKKKRTGIGLLPCDFATTSIGTVHTFQGKEADMVIVCLCADSDSAGGGIQFVNARPNLLNVALTRARKEVFVIGCHESWKGTQYGSKLDEKLPVQPAQTFLNCLDSQPVTAR